MKEKTIFIFEAESGMILSQDAISPDGHLVTQSGTTLNNETIQKISNFHILEITVEAEPRFTELPLPESTYFTKVRQTETFKSFNKQFLNDIPVMKSALNNVITSNFTIDKDDLLPTVFNLMRQCTNSLQLLDMLHSMREFDDLTYIHSVNVSLIAAIIGQWLNCSDEDIETLAFCGLLHDVGKLLIPNEILAKPGKLTPREFEIIKTHVSLGYAKLKDKELDTRVKEACLLHHERCDGKGYPFGLKGDKIPFVAKIISIADVYDAMTSSRVYRGSICPFDVIRMMEREAFDRFDPKYLLPFLNNIVSSYLNNNVKLSNGQIGEVVIINKNDLSRPTIKCGNEFIDLSSQRDLRVIAIL